MVTEIDTILKWKDGRMDVSFSFFFLLFLGLAFKLFHSLAGREVSTPSVLAKASLCLVFPMLYFPTCFLYFPLCGAVLTLNTRSVS